MITDFAPGAQFVAAVYDDKVEQQGSLSEYAGNG